MTGPDPQAAPDWSRLHPLTPLLRGGRFVLVALGLVGQQGLRDASLTTVAAGLAVVVPLGLLVGVVSWRTTRYRLTATELQVDTGLLQKRARRVPLARLQSVEVVRPLAARVVGLAELRLELAGGGDSEAPLAYLSEADAHALRGRLLGAPEQAGADSEVVLVTVPVGALVGSALLTGPSAVTAVLLLLAVVLAAVEPRALPPLLATLGPALLGAGGLVVRRLLDEYGATVAESPDGLRLRSGLLDTRASTIPDGRVQTVRVVEPLLWRPAGWVRVEVDVAGYEAGRGEQSRRTLALVPVAPRALGLALVDRVLGAPLPPADRPVPRGARLRAPLSARRLAVGLDGRHLVARSGVLSVRTDAVPLARVQSLRLTAGPWQRRLGLASVHADSAGRRLPGAVAAHRRAPEAQRLLDELTGLARTARRPAERAR